MISRLALALLLITGAPCAALASSPPPDRRLTKEQVLRATRQQFDRSDAILDATVYRDRRGQPFLKPIKVWKGPRLKSYTVLGDGSGVFLPWDGQKVRVLLWRIDSEWLLVSPVESYGRGMPKYDDLIDGYLRSPRPKDFRSVTAVVPPLVP